MTTVFIQHGKWEGCLGLAYLRLPIELGQQPASGI